MSRTKDVLVVSWTAALCKMGSLAQFVSGLRMWWAGYPAGETQLDSQG